MNGGQKHTVLRCFQTRDKGLLRHGVWVLVQTTQGMFIPGDRNEIQPYGDGFDETNEITADEAMAELESWPEGAEQVRAFIERRVISGE